MILKPPGVNRGTDVNPLLQNGWHSYAQFCYAYSGCNYIWYKIPGSDILGCMGIEEHDGRKIRCPMLGHELTFGYCRRPGRDLPCAKIFDCWFETFGVEEFIREHYTEEQIQQILAPAKPKMTSLLELIQQAQKNVSDTGSK